MRQLYEQGLCLQAYHAATEIGPFEEWSGIEALTLAGRILANACAPRLAFRLHARAYRVGRTNPEAVYYYARQVLERRGPLGAWEFLERRGELTGGTEIVRSDWYSLRGLVAAMLRDFQEAERWLERAEEVAPENPWLFVERSSVLEAQDRYEEALAVNQRSLALCPWFRPGVHQAADLLLHLGQEDEALVLLREGSRRVENGPLSARLALLQMEGEAYEDALESLDRFLEVTPPREKEYEQWQAGLRSDIMDRRGDTAEAIRWARQSESGFFQTVADRLVANGGAGRRVQLAVPFVRQHHQTCGPATLVALSSYWKKPANHLEVVDAICHGGTPDHQERHWAEENGWVPREFTVDRETAHALSERGIPFTLTTVEPANAHLQAVIGFDERRDTLLIRDPFHRGVGEFLAAEMLERYRSTGPRGMLMVPQERSELLDGLPLPDAERYDRFHHLQRALFEHQRQEAAAACAELEQEAPGHRLTLQARRYLAIYDADPTAQLAATDGLIALFPTDANLQLSRLSLLRELSRREDRVAALRTLCERKEPPEALPAYWQQYAQELKQDAREHEKAYSLLRRAIRAHSSDGANYYLLAELHWSRREFDLALPLYRFAACLNDTTEAFSEAYFRAARSRRQEAGALELVWDRFRRFGKRSGKPAETLFSALTHLSRTEESFAVLEEAIALRPDDGDLLLFAADAYGRRGHFPRAGELLESARSRVTRNQWLRASAALASYRGEPRSALALWQEVAATEPLAMDAHGAIAGILVRQEGIEAVREHFEAITARFPHSYALHQLWVSCIREQDREGAQAVLRRMVEINPADAWARRDLAWSLGQSGQLEEAFGEVEIARRADPHSPSGFNVLGQLCELAGRRQEARAAYAEAIRLSADETFAISRLMEIADNVAQRRDAVRLIEEELVRQPLEGDGLLAFRAVARGTVDPESLLRTLRNALAQRPDLWQAWVAVGYQLLGMDRLDEAWEVIVAATERFSLVLPVWLARFHILAARGESEAARSALEEALRIRPGWGPAVRQLAACYSEEGRNDEHRALLESAVALDPLDEENHGGLADALWKAGEQEPAIERLRHALRIDPQYEWAWSALSEWSRELERPELPVEAVRDLIARHPRDAELRVREARVLVDDLEGRLAALDEAVRLDPYLVGAYDLRMELLARAERWDEAVEALECFPARPEPVLLRGRAAWIEALRGETPGAIEAMRAVLADDPNYLWGWRNLAHWCDKAGDRPGYLQATEKLVQLSPREAVSHGLLGEARRETGDLNGAEKSWWRALELAPDYPFAGISLIDLQIKRQEYAEAARTLQYLEEHQPGEWIASRAVRLGVRLGDREGALARLAALCRMPQDDDGPLVYADASVRAAGWSQQALAVYEAALDEPGARDELGGVWVQARTSAGKWDCERHLPALLERGAIGNFALSGYLKALGEAHRRTQIRSVMRQFDAAIRADTQIWGMASHALVNNEPPERVIDWLRDWKEREDVQPWMVLNLVLALREQGRDTEAAALGREALEIPEDGMSPCFRLWNAWDEALTGNPEAGALLADAVPPPDDAFYNFVRKLVEAIVEAQRGSFSEARRRIHEARSIYACWPRDPLLRRFYRVALARIRKDVPRPAAALWTVYWTLPAVLLLPGPRGLR